MAPTSAGCRGTITALFLLATLLLIQTRMLVSFLATFNRNQTPVEKLTGNKDMRQQYVFDDPCLGRACWAVPKQQLQCTEAAEQKYLTPSCVNTANSVSQTDGWQALGTVFLLQSALNHNYTAGRGRNRNSVNGFIRICVWSSSSTNKTEDLAGYIPNINFVFYHLKPCFTQIPALWTCWNYYLFSSKSDFWELDQRPCSARQSLDSSSSQWCFSTMAQSLCNADELFQTWSNC